MNLLFVTIFYFPIFPYVALIGLLGSIFAYVVEKVNILFLILILTLVLIDKKI
jgi:hypothetical protein